MSSCPGWSTRGNALARWSISVACIRWRALERETQRLGDLQKLTEHNVLFAKDIKREFLMAVLTQHVTVSLDPQLPQST